MKNQVLQHGVNYENYFGNLYETSTDVFDNKPSNYTMNKINAKLLRNRLNLLQKKSGNFFIDIQPLVNYSKNIHAILHHKSCFKYSCECRNCLLTLPSENTRFDSREGNMDWPKWMEEF